MIRLLGRLSALAIVLALTLTSIGISRAQAGPTWLFVSDVHFNPLDDPALADRLAAVPVDQWDGIFDADPRPVSPYGTDANAPLLRLALLSMRSDAGSPAVVVIPGDLLVHNFRVQWNHAATDTSDDAFFAFADKTIAYLAHEFDAAFPAAQFVVTLGNNDSPYGDYHIQPHSPFLAHYERAWEPLVNRGGRAPDFAREFPNDGNYVATLPNGTDVVVVNSNAWSDGARSIDESDGGADAAAKAGMTWFEHAVAASPIGARTWALLHVPPGIDAFAATRGRVVAFYKPELLARFRAVRAADGKPLGLIVAGHIHNDGFRIVDRTPLWFIPSISPVHRNNPGYIVARVAPSGGIADYTAYDLDLSQPPPAAGDPSFGREYAFDARFAVHGFTLAALAQIQRALHDDPALRTADASIYVSGSPFTPITATNWPTFWCANSALDPAAFERCVGAP
jgi:sphingomyelin phosphodiesterase acid-like 3